MSNRARTTITTVVATILGAIALFALLWFLYWLCHHGMQCRKKRDIHVMTAEAASDNGSVKRASSPRAPQPPLSPLTTGNLSVYGEQDEFAESFLELIEPTASELSEDTLLESVINRSQATVVLDSPPEANKVSSGMWRL